jgi:hydroxyacyl-ACP dehydratase HTD2-like protein with hotdog domain
MEGTVIGPIGKRPDEIGLFLFGAATWNAHRIHYDRDHARGEGHDDLVVHGPLQGNWLVELVSRWAGPGARIRRVRYRNVGTAYVNREYQVDGTVRSVTAAGGGAYDVECQVWVRGESGVTTEGSVLVTVPGEPA